MRKFLIAIVVCLAVWGLVFEYRQHRIDHLLSSGDTVSPDGSAPSSGSTTSDGTILPGEQPQLQRQVVAPSANAPVVTQAVAPQPPPAQTPMVSQSTVRTAFKPSADDTISPNPPNGTAFTGTGHFQVYRQGNLTWRLNTDNGQSCILFATDEEWRKPRVYEHGCSQS